MAAGGRQRGKTGRRWGFPLNKRRLGRNAAASTLSSGMDGVDVEGAWNMNVGHGDIQNGQANGMALTASP